MRVLNYDWVWWFGELDFIAEDNGKKYFVMAGYVNSSSGLYVRIWDEEMKFIVGNWADGLLRKEWDNADDRISKPIIIECIEYAKTMEELRIFS